ncbi:hypothetical protein GCM10009545_20120 [Saccharopolyspora thermophila]|uniref:Uncharacterized protein n=1 Tax=Saccharopolyspora thermophila TaxID=89367 RepID=A0ABN1CFE7_9PSEU
MKISGNTVFIPGATSGIGLALALELQGRGNTVIVGGRRAALLEQIAAQHPGIDTVCIDTTDAESIGAATKKVLSRYPDLNVLVAMAGIMRIEDWHAPETFLASAESVITTNVLGPIRLIAAFIEHLRAQPDATIMTVSSGLAFVPLKVTRATTRRRRRSTCSASRSGCSSPTRRCGSWSWCRRPCAPRCCPGRTAASSRCH